MDWVTPQTAGAIIQHVRITESLWDGNGQVPLRNNGVVADYLEAWTVAKDIGERPWDPAPPNSTGKYQLYTGAGNRFYPITGAGTPDDTLNAPAGVVTPMTLFAGAPHLRYCKGIFSITADAAFIPGYQVGYPLWDWNPAIPYQPWGDLAHIDLASGGANPISNWGGLVNVMAVDYCGLGRNER